MTDSRSIIIQWQKYNKLLVGTHTTYTVMLKCINVQIYWKKAVIIPTHIIMHLICVKGITPPDSYLLNNGAAELTIQNVSTSGAACLDQTY